MLKPNGRYATIYQQVAKDHSEYMKTIASHVAKNSKFKEMKKGLMQMMKNQRQREVAAASPEDQSFDYGEDENEEQEGDSPQRRKRRKLLKSFREYTTANEEEGRFKGWSVRAGQDMGEYYMTKWSANSEFLYRHQLFFGWPM